jgi:hypothetical protein
MEVKMNYTYNPKRDDFKRVYAYTYENGNVIVYGENSYGHDIHKVFMMYDSLADVKRKLKADGVKNVSHMYKW